MKSLAILFLIIDEFPHEDIWREWASHGQDLIVSFYIHAKHPENVTNPWVKKRLVKHSFCPAWGSVDLTKAMLELLKVAVAADRSTSRFLYASESCLPIRTLRHTADSLWAADTSWLAYHLHPTNKYDVWQKWDRVRGVERKTIAKADQWIMLTRSHARTILHCHEHTDSMLHAMRNVVASDELYFATVLNSLALLTDEHVQRKRLTYCDWSQSSKHPRSYSDLDTAAIVAAQKEGCLFMRKFGPDIVLRCWNKSLKTSESEDDTPCA
jgi:Core-2/I-Branching enzyme